MNKPTWWTEQHDSTWDRVKAALKRDWEQTKADLSSKGHELNQSVGDTVKQAAGKEQIPVGNLPNPPGRADKSDKADTWDDVEPSHRYGAGARSQYGKDHAEWDERVESKLSEEWTSLKNNRKWDEVKSSVRSGWDKSKP